MPPLFLNPFAPNPARGILLALTIFSALGTMTAIGVECTNIGFAPAINFPAGHQPFAVAVADFNGDGKLDLVVANLGSDNVTILLGDGRGGFVEASGSPISAGDG